MNITASAWRFGFVGLAATSIHLMIAACLIEWWALHPAKANGIAFIVANLTSYIANTRWSFAASMKLGNWSRFVAVSAAAWLLTISIAWVVEVVGGHYLAGIGLVLLLVPSLSFIAHRSFTYRG